VFIIRRGRREACARLGDAVGLCFPHQLYNIYNIILCGHFAFYIFFSRVYTREGRWFLYIMCCVRVCDLYVQLESDYRMWHCWPNTQQLYIYSHNPTQTNTNYYYHQTPVIFRSNSNAIHNLTTLLFTIFSYNVTVFIQCLQNTRGSPRFRKWRSSIFS